MSQPRTADVLEFSRRAAVRGVRRGHSQSHVADLLGVSLRTVQRWWQAWRDEGEAGFPLRPGRGRPPKLSCEQAGEVLSWLDRSPTEYGFDTERWTAPRVAELVERLLGVRMHPRYLNHWLRDRGITPQLPARQATERDDDRIERWTLARRGDTPVLRHRARHRDKVSVAGAVTLSPARGHVALHYALFPDAYIDAECYSGFVRAVLLRAVRGPVVLLHDGGSMHKGPFVRGLSADHPRLHVDPLPPYAPEMNPVEPVWNFAKDKRMANYPPPDLPALERRVCECLEEARHDQHRLRSFLESTPLSWAGTSFIS